MNPAAVPTTCVRIDTLQHHYVRKYNDRSVINKTTQTFLTFPDRAVYTITCVCTPQEKRLAPLRPVPFRLFRAVRF